MTEHESTTSRLNPNPHTRLTPLALSCIIAEDIDRELRKRNIRVPRRRMGEFGKERALEEALLTEYALKQDTGLESGELGHLSHISTPTTATPSSRSGPLRGSTRHSPNAVDSSSTGSPKAKRRIISSNDGKSEPSKKRSRKG